MRLVAIAAIIVLVASSAPAIAQTGDLKKGIDAYWAGDYSSAVATLKKFLDTADLRFDILTARKFLAYSYLAVDERDRATEEFRKILDEDPKYELTSAEASPSTLKAWNEVRQRKQAEVDAASKKQKAEAALDAAKKAFAEGQYPQAQAGFRDVLKLDPDNQWAKAYLEQVTRRMAEGGTQAAPATTSAGAAPTTSAPPADTGASMDMGGHGAPADTGGHESGGPQAVTANPFDTLPPTPAEKPAGKESKAAIPDTWIPGDAAEARRFNEAVKLNNAGLASFSGGNYAAARSQFEQAIQTYSAHPMFHWNLGLAYERLRREDLAQKEYAYCVKVDPAGYGAQARRQLGLLLYRQQRWIEAARELEESLRAAPDDLDTRRYLSRCYEQAGNLENAIQTLVLLVKASPSSVDDRFALGNLYRKRGDDGAAAMEFRELLRIAPNYSQAAVIQGFLKAHEGSGVP